MQELWKIPSEPRNNLVKVGSQEMQMVNGLNKPKLIKLANIFKVSLPGKEEEKPTD